MPFRISFAKRHSYAGPGDTISLPVVLRSGRETISLVANLDTGAAYCLFERSYAEALGIDVERGVPMNFVTANSRFEAFGHEVTIGTLDLEVHSLVFFFADANIVKNVGLVDHQLLYLGHHGAAAH